MSIKPLKLACPCCEGTGLIPRGEYLRELREKLGLNQKQMAERLECSPQYISDIESNRRRATPEVRRAYGEL